MNVVKQDNNNDHDLAQTPSVSIMNAMQCVACLHNYRTYNFLITSLTSKFGELWSPAQQQLWPWGRSRSLHSANWKGLSQGWCLPNINALSLILQKIWARLKFLRQTDWRTNRQMSFNVPHFRERRGTTEQPTSYATAGVRSDALIWLKIIRFFSEIKYITFFAKGVMPLLPTFVYRISNNGPTLPRPSLSVCKQCAVVTFPRIGQHLLS